MARYTDPVCRICRREGLKLYFKGERCYTDKCAIDRRGYAPGQHGQGRKRTSEYGIQLREKQKARRLYGILEKQFRAYYEEAARQKGITGDRLLSLLETRLDNVVYRLGFAGSRPEARQLVKHGHFSINGHRVDIPSYSVRIGDVITVRDKSATSTKFKDVLEAAESKTVVAWLERDLEARSGKVVRFPERQEIDVPVTEQLIIEFYSR
ncbi:MAG: 30S ribosomal protein S4 [Acidibacillus sp.]|uniref:Small ribosomal subunit protein uS4 n=1 Tax=Sulfoacidibacillus ferrooxidans TaxID=2005001 RepID=A0A9X2AF88_9BACL|nr:30S ribosomal protein S4 [Sulfoacidibacillus ferrooxidans]MCI0183821.1 30S ribosomal protein S4 [Sulfoacidibacillus ferrooxidans]MCY0893681.1 30S ribosomal protein S4 [Acidibacillus sp.]